ncbi:MAG: hypothetical protein JO016_19005 [Actinobacteria bacterium]|nr:hypothetical protein [Actinomycetota bacterium]
MKPATGAAVAVTVTGLVLAVAACGQALPIGPAPAPTPAPSPLAATIVMQPGLGQPAAGRTCPAGQVKLTGPGVPTATAGSYTSTAMCFRKLGQPVTFTTAGVTVYQQPAGTQPVKHPAQWEVRITLPAAEAAELTTVTTKLAGTKDQLATIVGGQTWGVPVVLHPLTGGEFVIGTGSKSQALQYQRELLKPS